MMSRKREAGVLMPVSSLPSEFGIGCFDGEAYRFVDLLAEAGQSVWQILPLCPTSFGDSPYQSPSSFGGNPYFISLRGLMEDGLLNAEELPQGEWGDRVDYKRLYEERYPLLRLAHSRFRAMPPPWDYEVFLAENCLWLEDYALFSAIKDSLGGAELMRFPEALRKRDPEAMMEARERLSEGVELYRFLQYQFFKQWRALHSYAGSKNIKILGDMPIYVSADSSDVWARPELFELDRELSPIYVAGCPPDGFSPKGQLWGNPVYRWESHKNSGFRWWIERVEQAFRMYDIVRIDHFRGFEAYYSVPFGAEDATGGFWRAAPGEELFSEMRKNMGEREIIAEDLGYMTEGVRRLLRTCGFAGMKILQFGFDGDSEHLPYNYPKHSVVYTGTHDNPTLCGWLSDISADSRERLSGYLYCRAEDTERLAERIIAMAQQSPSELCIIPMQDYLFLGNEGRMNIPASSSGNWSWRAGREDMGQGLSAKMRELTSVGGRL